MLISQDRPSDPIKLRCPRCRKQNLSVVTVHTNAVAFDVQDGRITAGYDTGDMPEHIRTNAKCDDCGHEWRVRDETWKDPK